MRIRLAVALSAVSMLVLSGCGSDLSPDLHPGAAAVVGDQTITIEDVDARVGDYCELVLPQLQQAKQAEPLSALRSDYLSVMVEETLARQYADAHDLDEEAQFRPQQARIKDEVEQNIEAHLRGTARDYLTRSTYAATVETMVAVEVAKKAGKQLASQEDATALGKQTIARWAHDNDLDVQLDPRFDPANSGDQSLSFAVSDLAQGTAGKKPDDPSVKAYVASLPDSQKCG